MTVKLMKHEYSEKWQAFLENGGRLIFLVFISPIINRDKEKDMVEAYGQNILDHKSKDYAKITIHIQF